MISARAGDNAMVCTIRMSSSVLIVAMIALPHCPCISCKTFERVITLYPCDTCMRLHSFTILFCLDFIQPFFYNYLKQTNQNLNYIKAIVLNTAF